MIGEAEKAWVISKDFADIFRLIMLTGARRTEIVALHWPEVDLDRARLVLLPVRTKMGALNRSRHIMLSQAALEILSARKPKGEHVFPSSAGDKPLVGVNRAWDKVRTLAGIPDVRLHDLRHSFATFAVESGASLFHVGRALGHSKASTTERYAHPADTGARAVAADVAARFVIPPAPEKDAAAVGVDLKPPEQTLPRTPANSRVQIQRQPANIRKLLKAAARTQPAES